MSGRDPVNDTREKNARRAPAPSQQKKPKKSPGLAHQQNRAAADPVGNLPEDGPGDQLAQRVDRDDLPYLHRAGAKMLGVKRKERKNDRKSHDVHEHDQKDRKKRGAFQSFSFIISLFYTRSEERRV